MTRRVEPNPDIRRERYGHRLERPAERLLFPIPGQRAGGPTLPGPLATGEPTDARDLRDETIVRRPDEVPPHGWRRWVHRWTGGVVDPGLGAEEIARRALVQRIRRPLPGPRHIAVSSMKGGVGKTTVAACLGLVLAEQRGDRVVVLDANPDAGTLADRLTGESPVSVRALLRDLDRIQSWADMSRYTSLAGRLQVLASEQDPASGEAFRREEYEHVSTLLGRFFDITVTDSGTGLVHSAMEGTLSRANSLVVVGTPTVDGASRAAKTLDWLIAHGHGGLAADALVVLSHDRVSADVDAGRIRAHFTARCRAVVDVPHDPHLAVGGRIEPARLRGKTRDAFLELAALVTDRLPVRPGPGPGPGPATRPQPGPPARPGRGPGEHARVGPTLEG